MNQMIIPLLKKKKVFNDSINYSTTKTMPEKPPLQSLYSDNFYYSSDNDVVNEDTIHYERTPARPDFKSLYADQTAKEEQPFQQYDENKIDGNEFEELIKQQQSTKKVVGRRAGKD